MTRLLLLIAIGVIVFLLLRRFIVRHQPPKSPQAFVPMVSCMTCGLHLSRDAAIERDGRYFCSHEHADQSSR